MADVMASVQAVHDEPDKVPSKEEASQEPHPTFEPCPNSHMADFNFKKEVEHLSFQFNLGDVPLEKEHKAKFIRLIYSNWEVFSLHDKNLGYCDWLTHTNLTSTNKPVYLPHRAILRQLHREVNDCLNTWLCWGIICPSNSPYALQAVIVHKKSGKICFCVDYRKLNFITIRDVFPLPCMDEALQVVHNSNVFTSVDLVQGYLQLAVAEENIKKTTFRAGSSGLYEFIHIAFGLSNAGSSFCRLMEQCLGDWQFVTLMLYLDDICIFAPDVSTMLDHIELVFRQLTSFNLKTKPKKCYFFQASMIFLGYIISQQNICQPRKGWQNKRLASAKECQGIAFITRFSILLPPVYPKLCLHGQMSSPTNRSNKFQKKSKSKKKEVKEGVMTLNKPELTKPSLIWTSQLQVAFDALKIALTTAPVLKYPLQRNIFEKQIPH